MDSKGMTRMVQRLWVAGKVTRLVMEGMLARLELARRALEQMELELMEAARERMEQFRCSFWRRLVTTVRELVRARSVQRHVESQWRLRSWR